jgi:mono/diheme cytochrome c family protein
MLPVAELNHTAFFVLGLALVAVALIVSFLGLRFDKFPSSRHVLIGGTIGVAVLVAATMTFAWRNAEDEQDTREAELAADTAENEAAGNTTEANEEEGSGAAAGTTSTSTTSTSTSTSSVDGAQVFATAGCTGCHTLADAGSTATTGPDLDGALKGKDASFIKTSIVDPNAYVEKGYPPDVMPQSYGTDLSPEELDALVSYLQQATSGG